MIVLGSYFVVIVLISEILAQSTTMQLTPEQKQMQELVRQQLQSVMQKPNLWNQFQPSSKTTDQIKFNNQWVNTNPQSIDWKAAQARAEHIVRNIQQSIQTQPQRTFPPPLTAKQVQQPTFVGPTQTTKPVQSQVLDQTTNQLEVYPKQPSRPMTQITAQDQTRTQLEQQLIRPLVKTVGQPAIIEVAPPPSLSDQLMQVLQIVAIIKQHQALTQPPPQQNSFWDYCSGVNNIMLCGLDMFCCFEFLF